MAAFITNTDPLLSDLAIDAGNSARIDALIEVASDAIEKHCNRVFALATYAEYHDGSGINQMIVRNPPIVTLTSVVFRGRTDETVLGTYFSYNPSNSLGEIYWDEYQDFTSEFTGRFPGGRRNILINYDGGFSTIPSPVKFACSELVKQMLSPELAMGIVEMEKLGDYFYKLGENTKEKLFKTIRGFLLPYRLPNIPIS